MSGKDDIIDRVTIRGVTYYLRDSSVIDGVVGGLPAVTTDDDGSILLVVNGRWTVVKLDSAEEGTY